MSERDEKEPLWDPPRRCRGCNGYSIWNQSAGLWEPCECRAEDDENEPDPDEVDA